MSCYYKSKYHATEEQFYNKSTHFRNTNVSCSNSLTLSQKKNHTITLLFKLVTVKIYTTNWFLSQAKTTVKVCDRQGVFYLVGRGKL